MLFVIVCCWTLFGFVLIVLWFTGYEFTFVFVCVCVCYLIWFWLLLFMDSDMLVVLFCWVSVWIGFGCVVGRV